MKALTLCAVLIAIAYGLVAFVTWELNPELWSTYARLNATLIVGGSLFATVVTLPNVVGKEIEKASRAAECAVCAYRAYRADGGDTP